MTYLIDLWLYFLNFHSYEMSALFLITTVCAVLLSTNLVVIFTDSSFIRFVYDGFIATPNSVVNVVLKMSDGGVRQIRISDYMPDGCIATRLLADYFQPSLAIYTGTKWTEFICKGGSSELLGTCSS